jgi:hypothetical protein
MVFSVEKAHPMNEPHKGADKRDRSENYEQPGRSLKIAVEQVADEQTANDRRRQLERNP